MAMPRTSPMWTIVNDFHIEKTRLPVVVVTTEGERLTGDLFVQSNARNPSGHEDAPDVLNAPEPYFPLGTLSGRVLLCAKSQVREMHIPRDDSASLEWVVGTRAEVAISLEGGHLVTGTILIEQESARQRVLDFLNRLPHPFLAIYTAQGVVLVNRDFIIHVEQVS